jgi:hypothetical protein
MQHVNKIWFIVFLLVYGVAVRAQSNITPEKKSTHGTFYFAFGTNLSFYSKSDIRLKSAAHPSFDITLHDVRGKDDGGVNFKHGAPQYSYQVGYYKKNWGIEFNFDHIKYYVRQFQQVHMQGKINNRTYDTDTLISLAFIQLEHSDGANYALLKWVKWRPLFENKAGVKVLNLVLKAGAGPVVPKTNATIMGKHRDDRYKLAGYVIALEGGLRYDCSSHFFIEGNAKGAYADYNRFLIADGWGSQEWVGLHFGLLVGVQLGHK